MDGTDTGGRGSFWQLAVPVRGQLVLAGVLMAVGALSGLLPVAAAMALIQALVPALGGDPGATGDAWLLVVALVASLFGSQVLGMAGYVVSHFADATLVEDIRQRQITHLLRLPLVWFSRNASGRIKKVVQDDQVVVLDGRGGVEAVGDHDTLLGTSPTYRRFWAERTESTGWTIGAH